MKKKLEKLKNDIVLSIRYARLKEEINDAKLKKAELADKKNLLGFNERKISKSNQSIDNANAIIQRIEQNNSPSSYSLITDKKIKEQIDKLDKHKNSALIKYRIALETILDKEFEYTENTEVDFIEKISSILFNDQNTISEIKDDYKKISNRIYGTNFKSFFDSTAKEIAKLPTDNIKNNIIKVAAYAPKKPLVVAGTVALGLGLGYTYLKQRGRAKKQSTLMPGLFAKKLILSAMSLSYAANHFKNETDYKNYFKYNLKEINLQRRFIMKKLFEEHYEVDENQLKVQLLHNYDNYLIDYINLQRKNRSR